MSYGAVEVCDYAYVTSQLPVRKYSIHTSRTPVLVPVPGGSKRHADNLIDRNQRDADHVVVNKTRLHRMAIFALES